MIDVMVDFCKVKDCTKVYGLVASPKEVHEHIHDKHNCTIRSDQVEILNALVGRFIVTLTDLKGSISDSRVIK